MSKNKKLEAIGEVEGLTILGALSQLKDDIYKLQKQSEEKNQDPLFIIEEGELELKLISKKAGKGSTGFKLYVFDSSIKGSIEKEQLQTLKIKFRGIGSRADKSSVATDAISHSNLTVTPSSGPVVKTNPNITCKDSSKAKSSGLGFSAQ